MQIFLENGKILSIMEAELIKWRNGMLLLLITVLALLGAVGAFFSSGLVAGLLAFVGGWIGWLIVAALVLLIACALVDKDKEEENDSKFYRTLTYLWIDFVIAVGRVKIICKGAEKLPKDAKFSPALNIVQPASKAINQNFFIQTPCFLGKICIKIHR